MRFILGLLIAFALAVVPAGATRVSLTGAGSASVQAVSVTRTATPTSNANASTFTFTDQDIGAADPTRDVILLMRCLNTAALGSLSSVTIGGNTATIDSQLRQLSVWAGVARLRVTTGTTATIVMNMSSAQDIGCRAGVYRMLNASGTGPTESPQTDTALASGAINISMNIAAGGVGMSVAGFHSSGTNFSGMTWTGLTEDIDSAMVNAANYWTTAFTAFPNTQTGLAVDVTAAGGSSYDSLMIGVSYGP